MLHPTYVIPLKMYLQLNVVGGGKALLSSIKRRKAKWVGSISLKNFPLKQVNEGKIEGTGKTMKKT
jgi:hypothetical protein